MEQATDDEPTLRPGLAELTAERDQLRDALGTADAVIADLHRKAESATRAKSDFMARMTHEMRTPLSAIIGLAKLAVLGQVRPDTADYLQKIKECATTLLEIVDDITDFSRLEKGLADLDPVPFDLALVLDNLRTRFGEQAGNKGLTLTLAADPAIPQRLVGDQVRLEQILGHLLGNAVKFTEAGEVALRVTLASREADTVRLDFSVGDTGIGIDQATIPAMLESFTQADGSLSRPYGGTGLGLAIVQRGLRLLGGDLRVESKPGVGSCFSFRLSLGTGASRPQAAPEPSVPVPASSRPLSGAHILLVEDNAINQQVARETLQHFGATVSVAAHGGEAVDMVRQHAFDVVLMDVQMPVMDGLAATREIRLRPELAELPIVALTAHALAEDRDRCLAAGMNDYLTKPIDPDRLLATLGQWIAPAGAAAAGNRSLIIEPDRPTPPAVPIVHDNDSALDLQTALTRLGGNEKLLHGVVAEFARDYADSAESIGQAVAEGDLEAARRLAHTVKGVAGNIAAEPLAEAARQLDAVLRQGVAPDQAALDAFAAALGRTMAEAARLAPPEEAQLQAPLERSWRFLLVDDAKLNRAIVSQILRSAGHEVVPAINGKEACRLLFGETTKGRPFDCILMDIEMPEMDGLHAAKLIRRLLAASVNPPCPPDIPIVALTFHDAEAEGQRCLEAGMTACLSKVYDREELLRAIGTILEGRTAPGKPQARTRPKADAAAALPAIARGMARHLEQGSIRADEDLDALREILAGQPEPPELTALAEAIEHYDFSTALAHLTRLTRRWEQPPGEACPLPEGAGAKP